MLLRRVTITGADDATSIREMFELSREFTFVEWGILLSQSRSGGPRYPSGEWLGLLEKCRLRSDLQISAHVCGAWARYIMNGHLSPGDMPSFAGVADRIQINGSQNLPGNPDGLIRSLSLIGKKEFIFQIGNASNGTSDMAHNAGFRASVLFDKSGGAGAIPDKWPLPTNPYWCGYAGGLGPRNVLEQIRKIEQVCNQPYWIDMETGVRTNDGKLLDMNKVYSVLLQVRSHLNYL